MKQRNLLILPAVFLSKSKSQYMSQISKNRNLHSHKTLADNKAAGADPSFLCPQAMENCHHSDKILIGLKDTTYIYLITYPWSSQYTFSFLSCPRSSIDFFIATKSLKVTNKILIKLTSPYQKHHPNGAMGSTTTTKFWFLREVIEQGQEQ